MLYLTYDQLSWEFEEAPEDGEDFYSSLWLEFDSVLELEDREEKVTKRVQIFSRQVRGSLQAMSAGIEPPIKYTRKPLYEKNKISHF